MQAEYIRFALHRDHPDSGVAEGIMSTANRLADDAAASGDDRAQATALLRWFSDNLSTPTRFNKTVSKGSYRRATRGVSWFKASAQEHIDKMGALAVLIERYGYQTQRIRSKQPGYVVYEDDAQIVAEPFRDKRSR